MLMNSNESISCSSVIEVMDDNEAVSSTYTELLSLTVLP